MRILYRRRFAPARATGLPNQWLGLGPDSLTENAMRIIVIGLVIFICLYAVRAFRSRGRGDQ